MKINDLIGKILTKASFWLDPVFECGEACKVVLEFSEGVSLVILPLIDTDEISIELHADESEQEPGGKAILEELVGRKLGAYWYCENNQGYFDLVLFGFDRLRPSFGILSEGSSLKLVDCQLSEHQSLFSAQRRGKPS